MERRAVTSRLKTAPVAVAAPRTIAAGIGWLRVGQPEAVGAGWRILNGAGEVLGSLTEAAVAEHLVCLHNAALFREEAHD